MRRALALAAALLCACAPARPGLPPRHILLVTFDGLRADRLSCYAGPRPTSALPNDELERLEGRALALDDLSAAGVTFAHACAPSALTLPSLATLFTGLPPVATGVLDERSRLPLELPTLAELARAAGFYTAAFVSRPGLDVLAAVGRGFENAHGFEGDGEALAAAREWLDQHDFGDGRQVLLWIHLSGLEPPWQPIPAAEIARPEMQPLRFVDPAYHGPADGSAECFARVQRGTPALEPADRAALAALYDGRIAAVAGRLTTFLQDAVDFNRRGAEVTEFWSRTLLVLTATHGFDLGERGGRLGAELCDDFLRVPLILRHPDSITGERVLQPVVELSDVLPTLVELFDLPRPRVLPGRSLLGLTDAHPAQPFERRSAITQGLERSFSLRDARWRMVWNPYRSRLPENDPGRARPLLALYDHGLGSSGSMDVAAQHPEVVERLQQEVKDWTTHQSYRASLPLAPRQGPEPRGN
jgi:arylsulfatase A-like enzyme